MSQGHCDVRAFLLAVAAAGLSFALPVPAAAHDIPSDVTVQVFLKPEGGRLILVVRVPLGAMRDVSYPTRGPGYLDLARAEASLRNAAGLWLANEVELYEGDSRLQGPRTVAARVSLPSDPFGSYEEARAHVTSPPLPPETEIHWNQAMLDVLFEYEIQAQDARFSVRPRFGRLGMRVVTVLRFLPPGGAVRAFELHGDPGLVRLDPRWHQAALRFVGLGFVHILDGIDHLLFLFCLVIPFRRLKPLILVVTSFTAAHSVTFIAAAFDYAPKALWFPPLIEALIALSILYMALENIVAPRLRRRSFVAFGFGLVHGFGFSFALRDTLQFAGSHLLTSLLSFNLGVELGQILVLVCLIPALNLVFRFVVAERVGTIILSALGAHTAWHWLLERLELLRQFPLRWPATAFYASATRWLTVAVFATGVGWLVLRWLSPSSRTSTRKDAAAAADD
jgi:hypothetical protein